MADADLELTRQGGRFNADTGMLLTAQDIDRMGGMALQTLLHWLMLLHMDEELGEPLTGFPRDVRDRDHCRVTATSDLGYSVATGWGLFYNASVTPDEFGVGRYLPIVVDAPIVGTLDAHDGNPRNDLLCLAPAWVDDQSASRNVKNPTTGVVTASSVPLRRRFGYAVQVVKGTPAATPVDPSVPAGYVRVARAVVPATSGAAQWTDARPPLELGSYFKALPKHAVGDYVPLGDSTELNVQAQSPAALKVDVRQGRAVINGVSRAYPRTDGLAFAAADAAFDRIDLVEATQAGAVQVITGTPAVPNPPAGSANAVPLAAVTVRASATTVVTGDIDDLRQREPFHGTTHIKAESINHDRMTVPTYQVKLTADAQSGDTIKVNINVELPDGSTPPPTDAVFVAEIWEILDTTTLSGNYDLAGINQIRKYIQPLQTAEDYRHAMSCQTNCTQTLSAVDFHSPRMVFTIDDISQVAEIGVHMRTGIETVTVQVMVYPLQRTASNALVPGQGDVLDITFA